MSHLSDVEDSYNIVGGFDVKHIRFVKFLLIKYPNLNGEIDVDVEWNEFLMQTKSKYETKNS